MTQAGAAYGPLYRAPRLQRSNALDNIHALTRNQRAGPHGQGTGMSLQYDGSDSETGRCYYLESNTLRGLLQIASKLSSGDKIDADKRRDMAQWMQERLIRLQVSDVWD